MISIIDQPIDSRDRQNQNDYQTENETECPVCARVSEHVIDGGIDLQEVADQERAEDPCKAVVALTPQGGEFEVDERDELHAIPADDLQRDARHFLRRVLGEEFDGVDQIHDCRVSAK